MQFRDRFSERVPVVLHCPQDIRAKQSHKDECDINLIMAKYRQTGLVEHLAKVPPRWEDVSGVLDYHQAINLVMEAQDSFMSLPAAVRKHFDNDPAQFMAACQDPEQTEVLQRLGLLEAREVPPAEPEGSPEPTPAPSAE